MPTRIFVLDAQGAELDVDTEQRGTEQTCSVCGKVIYRQEADSTLTTDEARFAGQLIVAGYIPATANAGYIGQKRIDFTLCFEHSVAIIGKLDPEMPTSLPGPVPAERCLLCTTHGDHHHNPCAGTVDDGTEHPCKCFCQAGADKHQDQPVKVVAIIGPDGRDSGYTAFDRPDGTTRYVGPDGADVDEAAMREQFEHVPAVADRP